MKTFFKVSAITLIFFSIFFALPLSAQTPGTYVGQNHLAGAAAPFERAGAAQPVWWFPWNRATFVTAEALGRPIVLWFGRSGLRHVQAIDTLFESHTALCELLNAASVPVRVDADWMPDVAGRYGIAARAIGGNATQMGLVVLTTQGDLLAAVPLGGDHPPSEAAIVNTLQRVLQDYQRQRSQVEATAARLSEQLGKYFTADWASHQLPPMSLVLQSIREFILHAPALQSRGVPQWDTVPLAFLRVCWWLGVAAHDQLTVHTVRQWVQQVTRGPWIDLIGGGAGEQVAMPGGPAIYKPTSLNAQLLLLITDHFVALRESFLAETAARLTQFLTTHLLDRERAIFWHHEVVPAAMLQWSWERMASVLSSRQRQAFVGVYGAGPERHAVPVARAARTPAQVADWTGLPVERVNEWLHAATGQLTDARMAQHAVDLDATAYAQENGMIYTALFRAGLVFEQVPLTVLARRGIDWWWQHAVDAEWGVRHVALNNLTTAYYLSDQVWMLSALLAGYEATGEADLLQRAIRLARLLERRFADPDYAGFRDVVYREEAARLGLMRFTWRPFIDVNGPAANPLLAIQLIRLAALTGDAHWYDLAGGIVHSVASVAQPLYQHFPTYAHALWQYRDPPRRVLIAGAPDDPRTQALVMTVVMAGEPNLVLQREPSPLLHARADRSTEPQAMLCLDDDCSAPTTHPATILTLLQATSGERHESQ